MTTGRINQVTIAGRGRHRPTPSRGTERRRQLPHRSASSARVGGPRSQTVNDPSGDVLQSLSHESPTEGQRRARKPVASHSGTVDRRRVDTDPNVSTFRLHAKRCNPHRTDSRSGTRGDLPASTRSGSTRTAKQAGQCLSRNTVAHAAPRQDARQSNVCHRFH